MWVYIYLAVTVISLIVEFVTVEVVSVWFAGGGLVALILSLFNIDWYITIPTFIVVSFLMILLFRRIVIKRLSKEDFKLNADSAIGKDFALLSDITEEQSGTIKINGVIWNVVLSDENITAKKGEKVRVLDIKGNKFLVKKI